MRILAEAAAVIDNPSERIEYIRAKGGVHAWVPWVFAAIPVVGVLAAILIPRYLDERDTDVVGHIKQAESTAKNKLTGLFGTSNFDECILESMKGVTSETAAKAINRSCHAKYPVKELSDSEVPPDVMFGLDGRASYSNGYFEGTIYNGNKDWIITQLTITLTPKLKAKANQKDKPNFFDDPDETGRAKKYNIDMRIPPLTNKEFIESVSNDGSTEFNWYISGARGYKK